MLDWRIYLANGKTFSNEDGTWEEAPQDGLVAAKVRNELYGSALLQGIDFFYKALDGGPLDLSICDDIGPQLRLRCPWLKFGVAVSREEFKAILKRATNDPDFVRKHPSRRASDWGNRTI